MGMMLEHKQSRVGSGGSAGNGGVVVATTELEWTSSPSEEAPTAFTAAIHNAATVVL